MPIFFSILRKTCLWKMLGDDCAVSLVAVFFLLRDTEMSLVQYSHPYADFDDEEETEEPSINHRRSGCGPLSCHHCKVKKEEGLVHCCNRKPRSANVVRTSKNTKRTKACRKQYCKSCLAKYKISFEAAKADPRWKCPSCDETIGCRCSSCLRSANKRSSPTESLHYDDTLLTTSQAPAKKTMQEDDRNALIAVCTKDCVDNSRKLAAMILDSKESNKHQMLVHILYAQLKNYRSIVQDALSTPLVS